MGEMTHNNTGDESGVEGELGGVRVNFRLTPKQWESVQKVTDSLGFDSVAARAKWVMLKGLEQGLVTAAAQESAAASKAMLELLREASKGGA